MARLHPSELPHYAGFHSLSWALANKERRHGISWHMVEDMSTSQQVELDGGKVWFTSSYPIVQGHEDAGFDTLASLHGKTTHCVVESFPRLLEEELLKRGEGGREGGREGVGEGGL